MPILLIPLSLSSTNTLYFFPLPPSLLQAPKGRRVEAEREGLSSDWEEQDPEFERLRGSGLMQESRRRLQVDSGPMLQQRSRLHPQREDDTGRHRPLVSSAAPSASSPRHKATEDLGGGVGSTLRRRTPTTPRSVYSNRGLDLDDRVRRDHLPAGRARRAQFDEIEERWDAASSRGRRSDGSEVVSLLMETIDEVTKRLTDVQARFDEKLREVETRLVGAYIYCVRVCIALRSARLESDA